MYDVSAVRRHFPHTKKTIYFNVASTGPLPDPAGHLQEKQIEMARLATIGDQSDMFAALDAIRRNGARLFGGKKSEVGYGFNTTFGINLAAFGLPLNKGDRVLLSDVDFPANVYPWLELRRRGIKVTFIENDNGFCTFEKIEQAITPKTRVVAISLVQYFNGYKVDMEAVADLCRKRNIYLFIDAIQAAGCEPMHMKKWDVAIASAGAQKWLLSPQGTGLFYISEKTQRELRAPWRSWLSIDWKCRWHDLRRFDEAYENSARQFEMGTYPAAPVMAFDWALDFILGLGVGAIRKHNHALLDMLSDYIDGTPAYRVTSSRQKKHHSSILSFTSDIIDIAEVHRYLAERHIVTGLRESSIRVSVHLYNNRRDMQAMIKALDTVAGKSKHKLPPR